MKLAQKRRTEERSNSAAGRDARVRMKQETYRDPLTPVTWLLFVLTVFIAVIVAAVIYGVCLLATRFL